MRKYYITWIQAWSQPICVAVSVFDHPRHMVPWGERYVTSSAQHSRTSFGAQRMAVAKQASSRSAS